MTQQEEIKAAEENGLTYWIEHGKILTAKPVDEAKFNKHDYGSKYGIGTCIYGCGCVMGQSSSNGPVDPFGPCPNNPK